jgi:hypothetical protein
MQSAENALRYKALQKCCEALQSTAKRCKSAAKRGKSLGSAVKCYQVP